VSVEVRVVADLQAVRDLGVRCGLEDSGRGDEDVIAAWGAFIADRLVGSIVLERWGAFDTLNWMAVDERYRRRGVGRKLLDAAEGDALARGIGRLWVTARAPAFFVAAGYVQAPGDAAAALLAECQGCEQFGRGCEPRALYRDLIDERRTGR
jgi:N-acetylglutamate synthase-like GNAT family acetyltransferase